MKLQTSRARTPDKSLPPKAAVLGSLRTIFGELVEISVAGRQFDQIEVAIRLPGRTRKSAFRLSPTSARTLAALLDKGANVATVGEEQRREDEKLHGQSSAVR